MALSTYSFHMRLVCKFLLFEKEEKHHAVFTLLLIKTRLTNKRLIEGRENMNTTEYRLENWKRNIILFLSSQTVSLFGASLVQYAMMWYVMLQTESGMMMTLYIICGFIPTFLYHQ